MCSETLKNLKKTSLGIITPRNLNLPRKIMSHVYWWMKKQIKPSKLRFGPGIYLIHLRVYFWLYHIRKFYPTLICFLCTCILAVTKSAIWRRSSSCESPINERALSFTSMMYSRPSFPTSSSIAQISSPPKSCDTWSTQARSFSVTASCSSIAEPVLDFQLPLILLRLQESKYISYYC